MYKIKSAQHSFDVEILENEPLAALLDGNGISADVRKVDDHTYSMLYKNNSYVIFVDKIDRAAKTLRLVVNGKPVALEAETELDAMLKKMGLDPAAGQKVSDMKAPMPGLVLRVSVKPGDEVKKDDPLLVLEAMKMENTLKSPTDGVVKQIHVETGTAVEKNQLLVSFE